VTRDELLQKIWGRRESTATAPSTSSSARLRDKVDRSAPRAHLHPDRYGVGYKLEALPKEDPPRSGAPTAAA
jgi:DNA-binding response OmpR family regulator